MSMDYLTPLFCDSCFCASNHLQFFFQCIIEYIKFWMIFNDFFKGGRYHFRTHFRTQKRNSGQQFQVLRPPLQIPFQNPYLGSKMVPKGVRSNLRGWNFDMFVQSRGCTGCNPIPARWRRSYISLGHPETWSGSKSCRFVWIPYAPWCWYIHLHDWVILFGQMSVNIPAPWGIWGWCSLSFPLKHPFLGGFDYRRLQHPQGSPR